MSGDADFDEILGQFAERLHRGQNRRNGPVNEDAPWPVPEPLRGVEEEAPFPVESLPETVREAVVEYQAYGQQPMPMVVSSALTAMAGAVQGLADVQIEAGMVRPVSLNNLVIAA